MTPCVKLILCNLVIILVSKALASQKPDVRTPPYRTKVAIISKFFLTDIFDLKKLAAADIELARQVEKQARSAVLNVTAGIKGNPNLEAEGLAQRHLEDFKDGNGVDAVDNLDPNAVIENPISVYRLIRRWHFVVKKISKYRGVEPPPSDLIPEDLDFQKAVNTILVIQLMYDFNVTQFADGNIRGLVLKPKLRGLHCAEIGERALKRKMYVAAVEWLEEARRRAKTDGTIAIDAVNEIIAKSVKAHDKAWEAESNRGTLGRGSVNIYLNPLKLVPAEENTKVRDRLYNETKGSNVADLQLNSWGLCAGENLQSPAVNSHLFCWCEFKIHSVFKIGPLKMEFLDRNPDVVQIHNALSPTDITRMRESPTISLATSNAFQRHLPPSLSFEIARKFERIVGLNATGSAGMNEPMTRVSTTPGFGPDEGNGAAHTWSFHLDKSATGNFEDTFATILAYLNPVKQGGYTAFPLLLTAAEPSSGSAIFYFNVRADGMLDIRTLHFGCPVVVGQKYIALHRIPLQDQLLQKPCPLEPNERYQFPVNGRLLPIPNELRKRDAEELETYEIRLE